MIKKIKINFFFLSKSKISLVYSRALNLSICHSNSHIRQLALLLCYSLQHNVKTISYNLTHDEMVYLATLLFDIGLWSDDVGIIKWCTRNIKKIERKLR